MGFKLSKPESGEYLPESPRITGLWNQPISIDTNFGNSDDLNTLDPRSPLGCRTPLSEIYKQKETTNLWRSEVPINFNENPIVNLRKRILKGLSYNLKDPRSPSTLFNRTPITLDDTNNKSLDLDDTFSDLMVESKIPKPINIDTEKSESTTQLNKIVEAAVHAESIVKSENSSNESTLPDFHTANSTPLTIQSIQTSDPRSPSIGVDRTPIIFDDNADTNEDEMIESILATLSMNISNASESSEIKPNLESEINTVKLENKPLERVRKNGNKENKKTILKKIYSKRNEIYEDAENNFATPKSVLRSGNLNVTESTSKRTPLSCMKNKSHLRSRSVENSAKSQKFRQPFTSLDDSCNAPAGKLGNEKALTLEI